MITGNHVPAATTAGELWYTMEVAERAYEWKENGADYIKTVVDWRLEQGREASATVATMKHEIREI